MLAFLLGVAFETFFEASTFWLAFIPALAGIVLVAFKNKYVLLAFFLLAVFSFGAFWYLYAIPKDLSLQSQVGKNIEIKGIIKEEPELKNDRQKIIVETKNKEKVLINIQRYPEYSYGNILNITGKLEKPENFNDFDYKAYLAKDDIYTLMQNPSVSKEGSQGGSIILYNLFKLKKEIRISLHRKRTTNHFSSNPCIQ